MLHLVNDYKDSDNESTPKRGIENNTAIISRIGFKYQRPNGGLLGKLALTPFIPLYEPDDWNFDGIFNIVGFSLGYTF